MTKQRKQPEVPYDKDYLMWLIKWYDEAPKDFDVDNTKTLTKGKLRLARMVANEVVDQLKELERILHERQLQR